MIFRQGPVTRFDHGTYAEQSQLYTFHPSSYIATVGLAWDYKSWHVISLRDHATVPGALTGAFANLASLESALSRYLRNKSSGIEV